MSRSNVTNAAGLTSIRDRGQFFQLSLNYRPVDDVRARAQRGLPGSREGAGDVT